MSTAALAPHLTRSEIDRFHRDGCLGPFAVCAPEQMAAIRERIDREVLPTPGPWPSHNEQLRHQDRRVVYDLAANPEIAGRIASLWGPDVAIWRTNFSTRRPAARPCRGTRT